MRRIGLLTSGGDAPGMNAAIRAVVRHALGRRLEVVGIRRGYAGLLAGEIQPLTRAGVANILQHGGTILGTSRSAEFMRPEGRARAAAVLLPEIETDLLALASELRRSWERGKRSSIIVVAESGEQGRSFRLAEEIGRLTGLEPRVCIFGHIQRGGTPTARDRVLASRLGAAAVDILLAGGGQMAGEASNVVVRVPLRDTWEKRRAIPA